MLNDSLAEMQKSAAAVDPLFKKFAESIAGDVAHLQEVDAPMAAPLNESRQGEAVERIRQHVRAFKTALGEIEQALLNHAEQISLNWILPGDVARETEKVADTAKNVPRPAD